MSTTEPEDTDFYEVGMPTGGSESQGHWTWLGGSWRAVESEESWLSSSSGYPSAQLLKQQQTGGG